ncbi:MAG: universal stress protein [Gracilimonas sp.]|uniref:universal stress protein n=1 Tax=Gracilimonas TaxID=649462 RepID=UPI001B2801BA|nr:universal stress protein [Gracilimonas sp.]MBO6587292.1 universal stress protein [Gracilimonas sp.]MBO6614220.1 universal stress protein [Gracilimonas sp.]
MNVERVLIPTDLSEKSNAALKSADLFIDKFDCTVDLMHVIPLSKYLGDSFDKIGVPLSMDKDVYPKLIENQRKELSAFANEHIKKKDKRGEYIVNIDRKPSDSILRQIEKGNYDLVIMSAKGDHFADFFHGSATDKVIRRSKTPVLTLSKKMVSDHINTIVVPCDFSSHSLAAIPLAFDVAQKFGAKLELLNVIEMYAHDVHGVEPTTIGVDEEAVYGGLKGRLKSFFDDYDEYNFSVEDGETDFQDVLVHHGNGEENRIGFKTIILKSIAAHHEIIEYANENADLVVMSTHGRTGLSRMLLGSTTEQVIQHLEKPQITIKPELKK